MTEFLKAALKRAVRTLIQAAASSAMVAIGSATTIGEVNWVLVASTAGLSAILSLLTSITTGLPEAKGDKVETNGTLVFNLSDPNQETMHLELEGNLEKIAEKGTVTLTVLRE